MTNEMKHFVKSAKRMRDLQKKYFKTRNNGVLTEARDAERKFDQMLSALDSPQLFDA